MSLNGGSGLGMGYTNAAAFRESLEGPGEAQPEGTYVPLHERLRKEQQMHDNATVDPLFLPNQQG